MIKIKIDKFDNDNIKWYDIYIDNTEYKERLLRILDVDKIELEICGEKIEYD